MHAACRSMRERNKAECGRKVRLGAALKHIPKTPILESIVEMVQLPAASCGYQGLNEGKQRVDATYSVEELLRLGLSRKALGLRVRRKIDSRGRHEATQIDIRSAKLCGILQELYNGVDGLEITRNPPFCDDRLLYHSYPVLESCLLKERASQAPDEELIQDIEVALTFVHEDHAATSASTRALLSKEQPSITFDLLWTLFCPGSLQYSYDEYTEQGLILKAQTFRVQHSSKGVFAVIQSHIIAHDGKNFGYATVSHQIAQFEGARKLQDLAIYPLKYYPQETQLCAKAIARGKRFVTMLDYTYLETTGSAVYEVSNSGWDPERRRFTANGRVMIDPVSYRVWQSVINSPINPTVEYFLIPTELTDEEYMLCTPILLGFSFTAKRWGGFPMDRLTDVEWTSKPFDSLVLDPKRKELVHAMVNQHSKGTSDFDDIVEGKGKGLIGLLCGPPGCGKTLTAEAVAEVTRCPLYCLSAGELGTELNDVEQKLVQVLELAQRWKAVVLLDEADVFLAQRDSTDVRRNALVAIFLRKLEYYQGILILTTNLITHCDVAFESRIHFTIHYPLLSKTSRQQIWSTFIHRASCKHNITQNDIKTLANMTLNGRQIKNSVSVAQSFASGSGKELSVQHIYTVLDMMRDWEKAKKDHELALRSGSVRPGAVHTLKVCAWLLTAFFFSLLLRLLEDWGSLGLAVRR
ncbi:hypothetical protein H1R20_g2987, partial [Candolleomyces eurysporus]